MQALTSKLNLIHQAKLNYPVMVETRLQHQTRFCATAIRQRGRQMASSQSPDSNPDNETFSDFRLRVIQRLESILPSENGSQASMSGVVRHVRHLGVPLLPTASGSSKRQSNKAALRDIRARVIHCHVLIIEVH